MTPSILRKALQFGGSPCNPICFESTALSTLTMVADDLRFETCIGSCHRDGQALAISVGAPTVCIGVAEVRLEKVQRRARCWPGLSDEEQGEHGQGEQP